MARKKEPERVEINKARIVEAAKKLFLQNGVDQTSMEDIAREACICKATLYACYPNRDAIRDDISLEAMRYLHRILTESTRAGGDIRENFTAVCWALLRLKEKYPISFQLIVENIRVDDAALSENAALRETYETGEKINTFLLAVFGAAFRNRSREEIIEMMFGCWGSIYGLISIADNKAAYIQKATGKSRDEFLKNAFERLYRQMESGMDVRTGK